MFVTDPALDVARREFERAGLPVVDLNGDGPEFKSLCPCCRGELIAFLDEDNRVQFQCPGDCSFGAIADQLFFRTQGVGQPGQAIGGGPAGPPRYDGRIIDVRAMLAAPEIPLQWRCDRLAADGYLTVLTGRGKEGKTWLALALAAGVARGEPAAGINCAKGSAMIFDAENGPRLLKSRWHAAGMSAELAVQPIDAGGIRFTKTEDMEWIRSVIADHRPDLVIFDSLRIMSSGTKESDGDEMEPVVTSVKQLARDTAAAVILIHHRGKGESAYRGSSVILDQTDMMFALGRVEGDPDAATRRRIDTVGCRIAEEPSPRRHAPRRGPREPAHGPRGGCRRRPAHGQRRRAG